MSTLHHEDLLLSIFDEVCEEFPYLNEDKQPVADLNEIRVKAAIVLRNNPKTPFMVEGDKAVAYDAVVQAMVLLQQAGVPSIGLVTDPTGK